jgi:hypothetical protein
VTVRAAHFDLEEGDRVDVAVAVHVDGRVAVGAVHAALEVHVAAHMVVFLGIERALGIAVRIQRRGLAGTDVGVFDHAAEGGTDALAAGMAVIALLRRDRAGDLVTRRMRAAVLRNRAVAAFVEPVVRI